MTYNEIVWKMLRGDRYLRQVPGTRLRFRFKLYEGNEIVLAKVGQSIYKRLSPVLIEKKGKLIVSRRSVQRLPGQNKIKRIYREVLKQEKAAKNV